MRDIPKVGNRHRRKVDVKVDVDEEVIRVNEGVLVGGNEILLKWQPGPTQDRRPQRGLVPGAVRSMIL